jgi:hypothetical protein
MQVVKAVECSRQKKQKKPTCSSLSSLSPSLMNAVRSAREENNHEGQLQKRKVFGAWRRCGIDLEDAGASAGRLCSRGRFFLPIANSKMYLLIVEHLKLAGLAPTACSRRQRFRLEQQQQQHHRHPTHALRGVVVRR